MRILQEVGIVEIPVSSIIIRQELRVHNILRRPEDRQILKEQIIAEGIVRDPAIVWNINNENILVDGFNRYEICQEINQEADQSGLPYPFPRIKCYLYEFESFEEAKYWITINQNSRRNLTDMQRSYMIGRLYNSLKTTQEVRAYLSALGQTSSSEASDEAEKVRSVILARHYNMHERTVRRAASFAQGLDRVQVKDSDVASAFLYEDPTVIKQWSMKLFIQLGEIADKQFSKLRWEKASDLLNAIKPNSVKSVDKNEDSLTVSFTNELRELFEAFITSPSKENLDLLQASGLRYIEGFGKVKAGEPEKPDARMKVA